jgi:Mu transposase, C-terminal domain
VPHLRPLPGPERVEPFLREERRVGRDGFVAWERGWYGVPWTWAGQRVHVASTESTVELWAGGERLAVHPRATRPGQRLVLPGQWAGLPRADARRAPAEAGEAGGQCQAAAVRAGAVGRRGRRAKRGAGPQACSAVDGAPARARTEGGRLRRRRSSRCPSGRP